MSIELEDRDYSAAEVAKIFNVHIETVKLWLGGRKATIKLEGRKEGNKWLVAKSAIVKLAQEMYGSKE